MIFTRLYFFYLSTYTINFLENVRDTFIWKQQFVYQYELQTHHCFQFEIRSVTISKSISDLYFSVHWLTRVRISSFCSVYARNKLCFNRISIEIDFKKFTLSLHKISQPTIQVQSKRSLLCCQFKLYFKDKSKLIYNNNCHKLVHNIY